MLTPEHCFVCGKSVVLNEARGKEMKNIVSKVPISFPTKFSVDTLRAHKLTHTICMVGSNKELSSQCDNKRLICQSILTIYDSQNGCDLTQFIQIFVVMLTFFFVSRSSREWHKNYWSIEAPLCLHIKMHKIHLVDARPDDSGN